MAHCIAIATAIVQGRGDCDNDGVDDDGAGDVDYVRDVGAGDVGVGGDDKARLGAVLSSILYIQQFLNTASKFLERSQLLSLLL